MVCNMDRIILHSDLNSFYASVECLHRPHLKNLPVAVGGSEEARHGIILAKNKIAEKFGVKTAEPLWQARNKCKNLVIIPPDFAKYTRFSRLVREIYLQYTDRFEPFGIDEGWLDVTESAGLFGSGREIAEKIRNQIKREMGLTVSVGVSWNKIYAKLGSDYKKPDAVTVFNRSNYRNLVFPQPVGNLLFVGKSTQSKLKLYGIDTIGDLAACNVAELEKLLGKWGIILHDFAVGKDESPVALYNESTQVKSISNSTTTPRDLVSEDEVKVVFTVLAESVAMRLREQGLYGSVVRIYVRDTDLHCLSRSHKLKNPTCLASEIINAAIMELFQNNYMWRRNIRSLGVGVSNLADCKNVYTQCDIFSSEAEREKKEHLAQSMDEIRRRFGNFAIQRGSLLQNRELSDFDSKTNRKAYIDNYNFK